MRLIVEQGSWRSEGALLQLWAGLFVPGTRIGVIERRVDLDVSPEPDAVVTPKVRELACVYVVCRRGNWGHVMEKGGVVADAGPVLSMTLPAGSEINLAPYSPEEQVFAPGQTYQGYWPQIGLAPS